MIRLGKMFGQLMQSLSKKPATRCYPKEKAVIPEGFRGKLKFYPARCIGCKMCMRDCPSTAIEIREIGQQQFEAEIDLAQCIYCGQCVDSCVKKALEITSEFELAQLDRNKLKVIFNVGSKEEPQGKA